MSPKLSQARVEMMQKTGLPAWCIARRLVKQRDRNGIYDVVKIYTTPGFNLHKIRHISLSKRS